MAHNLLLTDGGDLLLTDGVGVLLLAGPDISGSIDQRLPALTQSATGAGAPNVGTAAQLLPALGQAALGVAGVVVATRRSTVQVRAVSDDGTLIALVGGINVERIAKGVRGVEQADLVVATLHPDAKHLNLFQHEVQLWLDGDTEPYFWGRPARLVATRDGSTDALRVQCDSLTSYFDEKHVGQIPKPNHITPPHEDAANPGLPPASWGVEGIADLGIVTNNAEFWQTPKAIQLNGDQPGRDAYIWQRFSVPADLDRVPFEASVRVYIADGPADVDPETPPPWGGAAANNRGLVIVRREWGGGDFLSDFQVAPITSETPRNQVVRLQTPSVFAHVGEEIEVRVYSPAAWIVVRHVGLFDGRALIADDVDKAEAFRMLVEHAQDVSIGKQNHRIGTDIVDLGKRTSKQWPWWRRDNILEQLMQLADDFEFTIRYTATDRWLQVRNEVGVTHSTTLTKTDLASWSQGEELAHVASRVIRQGEGSGIARDEYSAIDTGALGGHVREAITFGPAGEMLYQLRDNAEAHLDRVSNIPKLPQFRIVGELARAARPGDRWPINLDHGWASFVGYARSMVIDYQPREQTALLTLQPT